MKTNRAYSFSRAHGDPRQSRGFTLIEAMIVVAIIAIILTLALPVYQTYTVRAKVGEALSVAAAAKTSTADTCTTDPDIPVLNNVTAGYDFQPSTYVGSIVISGACSAPVITMTTVNTGAEVDPVLIITGTNIDATGRLSWECAELNSQNTFIPETCRG